MQLMTYRKHYSLSLTFALATLAITPSTRAIECDPNVKKALGTTALVTALACFVRLVTKKTQPKRIYPADDSFSEVGWYIFDELLVGQMEKGERPSKVVIDDPENPHELSIQYSKVESRGLAGILYSTLKPVIIPTLTFMIIFNKLCKDEVAKGIRETKAFIQDPFASLNEINDAIWK